jgi:hypothetical protein
MLLFPVRNEPRPASYWNLDTLFPGLNRKKQ